MCEDLGILVSEVRKLISQGGRDPGVRTPSMSGERETINLLLNQRVSEHPFASRRRSIEQQDSGLQQLVQFRCQKVELWRKLGDDGVMGAA